MAVVIAISHPWGEIRWWLLPATALGIALAEWYTARLVVGRQGITFELTDAILAACLIILPGSWLIVGVAIGTALGYGRRRRQWLKLVFNITNFTCSAALAVLVTLALGSGVVPSAAGVLTFVAVNHMLTGFAVAMAGGRRYRQVLADIVSISIVITIGNASVGVLGGWLAVHQPAGLIGLIVPVGLLWWSYEQQTERSAEARLFAEIARGQETIAVTSVDTSAQVVVTAAARVFGGAEVEMLLRHPGGVLRYLGDENGVSERGRADADAFGAPWSLRAMAARGTMAGVSAGQPFVSAVLGDADRPLAVLIVRRPARAGAFTRADLQLAEVLVAQAESWLSVADLTAQADEVRGEVEVYKAASRMLGDLGDDTAPALAVLRESADRLARLANGFDGPDPVSDIIEELHAVERAVASLLGAVAMAQPERQPERIPTAEWTTTGRLESADVQ
ncbi:MAG TPA: hypothetical protein VLJ59_12895 [Mycobacteriales bacterium]|nr:hypothetical protein [Mycobacteriales bacterium]